MRSDEEDVAVNSADAWFGTIEETLQSRKTVIQALQPTAAIVLQQPPPPFPVNTSDAPVAAANSPRRRLDPSVVPKLGADVTRPKLFGRPGELEKWPGRLGKAR